MDDFRLDPEDVGNLAAAAKFLMGQPYVDAGRCGILGTCVGGSFALLAAAEPAIRDQLSFVGAFAPYASMRDMSVQIVSGTRSNAGLSEAWTVDQLTRKVFVPSLTAGPDRGETEWLRSAFSEGGGQDFGVDGLSEDGRALHALLDAKGEVEARSALERLPQSVIRRMDAMSPINHLHGLGSARIILGHDRDDLVIPVGESRRLWSALGSQGNTRYTEFGLFQHADPTKRKLPPHRLARELWKFFRYVYPMFREVAG
jgi:hypothetical protein